MSGELERVRASVQKRDAQLTEFVSLPEEAREAALEYARGLMLAPQEQELPDGEDVKFLLVGVEQGGRAILFASSSVAETRFARQFDGVDRVPITANPKGPVARVPRMTAIVGAKMSSFEQYIGHDYGDAVRTMLSEWERKRGAAERRALEDGR